MPCRVTAADEKAKVYIMSSVSKVEFGMRVLRCWTKEDNNVLDTDAVAQAEVIMKVWQAPSVKGL